MKLRVQQHAFGKFLAREARVRRDIENLTQQARQSHDVNDQSIRAIGADVLWQAWTERSKSTLNRELAEILAQKSHYIEKMRSAHGKVEISNALIAQHTELKHRKKIKSDLEKVLNAHLFSASKPEGR